MSTLLPVLLILTLFVAAVGCSVIAQRRRREALAAVAGRLGFTFAPVADHGPWPELGRHHRPRASNLRHGERYGTRLAVFDWTYHTGSSRRRHTRTQTVVRLEAPHLALPRFALEPEHALHSLAELFGAQDIDLADDPAFSRMYVLRGDDPPAIRRLFDAPLRHSLTQRRGVSVEGGPGTLFIYCQGRVATPDQIEPLVLEAAALCQAFRRPPPPPVGPPPVQGP